MFRPRLSEPEIKFLLKILEPQRQEAEIQYRNILSRNKSEVDRLKTVLKSSSKDETEQSQLRLGVVQKELGSSWRQMVLYQGLCVRFKDLLGHKKRGKLRKELAPELPCAESAQGPASTTKELGANQTPEQSMWDNFRCRNSDRCRI